MPCLDDAVLLDIAEGRRSFDASTQAHLAGCSDCRLVFAAAVRGAKPLPHDGADTLRDLPGPPDGEPSWDELGAGVVIAERYELDRFVGAGSMGVVWAARRQDDGAEVALKIARSTDPELARRFEREARITASLNHPNIVPTLDVIGATLTRGPCLVLPLLTGEPFEALLARRGALPLAEAARFVLPVSGALATAHARGVVHRDLKPQNVFVTPDRVVVLDFGIAKLLPGWGTHSRLTGTGAVLGTPSYMAPEQVFGERDIDARADIWALGAVLFRALSGRPPILGGTLGHVLAKLRTGGLDDLAALTPGLPDDVVEVVRSALVLSKEKRLGDVLAFARVLSRYA